MRRPLPQAEQNQIDLKPGFSKAAQQQYARRAGKPRTPKKETYTVIDLETTGLQAASDAIIEYGALRVRDGAPAEELSLLARCGTPLPAVITELTGLRDEDLQQGMEERAALEQFLAFIGNDPLVGHNISFDMEFLRAACRRHASHPLTWPESSRSGLPRRRLSRVPNYKLLTLAQHFQLADKVEHRALPDCRLVQQVYCKLNEPGVK